MAIKYTVRTVTKSCPYCGRAIYSETYGRFTPLIGIMFLLTFPISAPYLVIRYLVLKNPAFPKIGNPITACPSCHKPILTGKKTIADLDEDEIALHKFKKWVYLCYALGAVLGISIFLMLSESVPIVSILGLTALLSLAGIIAIVIIYYKTVY